MSMARFHRNCVRQVCWALVLGCWATSVAAATAADRLEPRRDLVQAEAERFRRIRAERLRALPPFVRDAHAPHAPRRTRPHRSGASIAAVGAPAALAAGLPDTVHILVARIGFATNREPSLTSMSGHEADGFFLTDPDPAAIIDPPPHDAAYFDAHLLALQSYYDVVSRGQLVVEGTVFPPAGEPALTLSDIADYGPGAGGRWTLELFERYFHDAITLLDGAATGRIDLGPYTDDPTGQRLGSIVLVHPGSDFQNDINQDSPNDLPTFFITLADSIAVQGNLEVRHGLVLPETTIQDGLLGSIQGPLCHEVGHLLGLPDWYDTRFGLPTIGEWSLMDSGSAALFAFVVEGREDEPIFALGLLPTGLSALDRVLLGWEEPYAVRAPADSVTLRPANADTRFGDFPTSARLDVSPEEYFLVENRRDLLGRRFPEDRDFCPYLNRDLDTGVVLWMSKDDPNTPSRERHNTGEYDFWVSAPTAPDSAAGAACGEYGFGLLVWHVDERPLAEGYSTNSVNNDEHYRALRVIEASGDYEIGDWRLPTVSFLGDGWNDPFRQGHWTVLGSKTVPNNWNSDWALTGWEITDVRSVLPEAHRLYARMQDGVAGWPQTFWISPDSLLRVEPKGALVAEVSGLGRTLVVADSGAVHLWNGNRRVDVFESGLHPGSLASASATFAADAFGTLAALDGDSLRLWQANWDGTTLPLRSGFPLAIPGGAGTRIVLATEARMGLAETKDGAWLPFDATGWSGTPFDLEPGVAEAGIVVGDLRSGDADSLEVALAGASAVEIRTLADSRLQIRVALDLPAGKLFVAGGRISPTSTHAQVVILHEQGRLRVIDGDGTVLGQYGDLPADRYVGIALADIDADGFLDLIATSTQRLVGLNSRGARLFGTPRSVQEMFALRAGQNTVTPPVVADVTGDALPEILWATDLGLLYALDAGGTLVPGYPRKVLPDLFPAALLADDLDALDGTREVIGVSSASAAVFALPGGGSTGSAWSGQGGGAARTHFATADTPPLADAGDRLRALERPILAYPNPSRGDLVQLRIASAAEGPYEIRIYNLEGELVFENHGMVRAGAAQEIPWSVSHLASGIYLCRFVSPAAGVVSPLVERISVLR